MTASTRLEGITDLRAHTARGTVINAAFQVGLAGLTLLRRFGVAAFLTATEFGIWGVLFTSLSFVLFIKSIGTADKYVQQDDADQERAFQQAFTIDFAVSAIATVLAICALPLFAAAYDEPDIIVPGIVLSLAILGNSLQTPIWVHYRRMRFVRQRTLQAVDPVVAFVVTIGLAVLGAGFWSLIVGAVAGSFAGAAVAVAQSEYRLRLVLDRGTLRDYFGFSWPLLLASGGGVIITQATVLIAARTMSLAAVGAIGLAAAITAFTGGVDRILTQTIYPAICAVRERRAVLFETFVKSNRLALMWGLPFGLGLALFAPDLVRFVFGPTWDQAGVVLQAFGLGAAMGQIGFNWTAFMRALNRTRPLAVLAGVRLAVFAAITAPLLVLEGLPGYALGTVIAAVVNLAARAYFLQRLFAGFRLARHAVRALTPVVPAVAVVLLMRLLESGERTGLMALAEGVAFVAVTAVATLAAERKLLREVTGYLRPGRERLAASA